MAIQLRDRPYKPVNPKARITHSFTSAQKKIIWNWFYENTRKQPKISKNEIVNLFQRAARQRNPQIGTSVII